MTRRHHPTRGTLLARYSYPLPSALPGSAVRPSVRPVVNFARWTFLVAKTEVVIFHLPSYRPPPSSFLPSFLRVASSPLGMSRQTCAIIAPSYPRSWCAQSLTFIFKVARIGDHFRSVKINFVYLWQSSRE